MPYYREPNPYPLRSACTFRCTLQASRLKADVEPAAGCISLSNDLANEPELPWI